MHYAPAYRPSEWFISRAYFPCVDVFFNSNGVLVDQPAVSWAEGASQLMKPRVIDCIRLELCTNHERSRGLD